MTTTDPTLIADLEAATGPCRELDARIAVCAGWKSPGRHGGYREIVGVKPGGRGFAAVPRYTASLDAALTLVPEGFGRWVDATLPEAGITVEVREPVKAAGFDGGRIFSGDHRHEAIALAIAALRARGR